MKHSLSIFLLLMLTFSIGLGQVEINKRIEMTGNGDDTRVTGIDSVQDPSDAVNVSTLQSGRLIYSNATGSGNSYTLNLTPAITAISPGQTLRFKANHANTGSASITINGIGPTTIYKDVSVALDSNDILNGQITSIIFDGTNFQMLAGSAGSGGGGGSTTVTYPVKRMFITLDTGNGDFATWAKSGGTNGVAGADNICTASATAAGLGGTWKAFISTSTLDAKDRFSGIEVPLVNMQGHLMYWNGDELYCRKSCGGVKGAFRTLDYHEDGTMSGSNPRVWSGTHYNGKKNTPLKTCQDWTSSSGGDTAWEGCGDTDGSFWMYCSDNPCNLNNRHLVCIED